LVEDGGEPVTIRVHIRDKGLEHRVELKLRREESRDIQGRLSLDGDIGDALCDDAFVLGDRGRGEGGNIDTSTTPERGTKDRLVADHCKALDVVLEVISDLAFGQIACLFHLGRSRDGSRGRSGRGELDGCGE